jgi:hypothetical protein
MPVRAYYRNSTDKQAQARTVESQRAPVGKLVAQIGEPIASEHVDEGISGAAATGSIAAMRMRAATATSEERREIVRTMGTAIVVTPSSVKVQCLVPGASRCEEHETQRVRLAL